MLQTSAVVSFQGTGAPLLRQRFQVGPRPGDTVQIAGQNVFLHYVPSCKHLGTIFAANHRIDLEIRCRIGQAQAAFNHLPECTRIQLFHTLIGTKLFFGLGAWTMPTHRQMAQLKVVLLRMPQKVMRLPKDEIMTTPASEVFWRAKQPDPRVRLAVDGLLYAQRLWEHGPEDLQHLIHREQASCTGSWMEGLLANLQWLRMTEQDAQLPIDLTDLTALFDYWRSGSPEWQQRVKRAYIEDFRDKSKWCNRCIGWISKSLPSCRAARRFWGAWNMTLTRCTMMYVEYTCFCGRSFTTAQGLAPHKRQKHQIGAMERHL